MLVFWRKQITWMANIDGLCLSQLKYYNKEPHTRSLTKNIKLFLTVLEAGKAPADSMPGEGSLLITSSNPNYFPKDPTPNTIPLRVGFQNMNFGEYTDSVYKRFLLPPRPQNKSRQIE